MRSKWNAAGLRTRLPSTIFLEEVPFAAICYILWLGCAKTLEGLWFWLFAFTFTNTIFDIFVVGICTICVVGSAVVFAFSSEVSFLGVCGEVWIVVGFTTRIGSDSSVSLRVSNVRAACCVSSEVLTFIVLLCFSIVLLYDFSGGSVS
jgi:hypothetical protein